MSSALASLCGMNAVVAFGLKHTLPFRSRKKMADAMVNYRVGANEYDGKRISYLVSILQAATHDLAASR